MLDFVKHEIEKYKSTPNSDDELKRLENLFEELKQKYGAKLGNEVSK